jgi:hypothetical protein
VAVPPTAIAVTRAHALELGLANPAVQQVSSASAVSPGSLPRAGAASALPAGGGASSDSGPGAAIGIGAVLGLLGLAAFRSGQAVSGLAAVHGTGGLRATSQSLLTFAWSGSCTPVGAAHDSPTAAGAGGAVHSSTAAAAGGRGEAKGVLNRAPLEEARGGSAVPSGLGLIDLPSGGGGPSALVWGLLIGASAAFGALVGRVSSGGFAAEDEGS